VLPVYVQPSCPEPGLIWTPGYWAYGDDGYYWVPGAWVPAPYEGALWTPPYWGWEQSVYVFHPGYWGHHVGYYGGINYGFGYFGLGFVGGEWHGREFAYNTAVVNVNRTVIRNTYVNETVIRNTTIVQNNHVAYAGGPGGIRHEPTPEERVAMRESHSAPTAIQEQHFQAARMDHGNYFKANNGRPQNVAVARPLTPDHHPTAVAGPVNNGVHGSSNGQPGTVHGNAMPANNGRVEAHPEPTPRPDARPTYQPQPGAAHGNAIPANGGRVEAHPAPTPHHEQPQSHPAPQPRYEQPQPHAAPQPHAEQVHPAPQPRYEQPQARPMPQPHSEQVHPAPQPRQESHPEPEPRSKEPHR
jgi:hypothetical protein